MSRTTSRLLTLLVVVLAPALAAAQPAMPTPGPEHALLKEDAGTWDATIELLMPGVPPGASQGVEVSTLGCNGMCLSTEFKGTLMGAPFQGAGITTWDPQKKVYIGSWSDSMTPGLMTSESTWDAAKKTLSGTSLTPDGNGGTVKLRSVIEYTADGKRVFSMFMPGPDGKEVPSMRITYTRQKK